MTQSLAVAFPAPLARLEQAHQLLAQARDVDEVKSIMDLAEAARVYARQARLGLEAQNYAAEIKLRAERRAGELLADIVHPGNPQFSHADRIGRLPDGITFSQSSRWQRVASVPEPVFEQHITESKSRGRELTTADTLRLAPRVTRPIVLDAVPPQEFRQCAIKQADAAVLPLPDGVVDLIVTSPPYGLGIDYAASDDDTSYPGYLNSAGAWAAEMFRIAGPQGRLCLNVPLDSMRGGPQPVAFDWLAALRAAGWTYRTCVVWTKGNGNTNKSVARGSVDSPSSPYLMTPVEVILVCHKGAWGLDLVAPHNLEHDQWLEWTNGLWTFPGESRDRFGHPAPFPEELPRRCISLFSFRNAVVCDPFVGSGTSAVVAHRLGRTFYGFDVSTEYVALARARVAREMVA